MIGDNADYISQDGSRKLYIPKYINTRTGEDITELIDIQYSNDELEN
jgi:hypothetical protein